MIPNLIQLTKEQQASIIAMYLLQDCVYDWSFGKSHDPLRGKVLSACSYTGEVLIKCYKSTRNDVTELDRCKLLLKTFSEMSEEDAIALAKLEGLVNAKVRDRTPESISIEDDTYLFVLHDTGTAALFKNNRPHPMYSYFMVPQFACKKGYAIQIYPYCKTAIELGMAIKESELSL